jgi:Mrp family chromosome partitioning ATPase
MGRMLEVFKLVSPHRPQPPDERPAPHLSWPQSESAVLPVSPLSPCNNELDEPEVADEEVPFIEVGGPRATTEASPQVLAAGAKLGAQPPASRRVEPGGSPRLRPVMPPSPVDAPVRIMTVMFRPLPPEPSAVGPIHRRFAPELVAFHRSEHPASEQYRTLTEGIAEQLPAGRAQVLMFTSLNPDVGTTTVLLNAAITFARQGSVRVCVLEANLRRPALAQRLGLPEAPGLRDVLTGTVSLTETLQETGQPNLLAVTAGEGGSPRGLGDALRAILRQLRERFDLVLVDAPCWDGRPEIVALGSACDSVYLVLPEAEADTPETEAWVRTLPQEGARLRGCIVTQR